MKNVGEFIVHGVMGRDVEDIKRHARALLWIFFICNGRNFHLF